MPCEIVPLMDDFKKGQEAGLTLIEDEVVAL
jgi:hypothetical protein